MFLRNIQYKEYKHIISISNVLFCYRKGGFKEMENLRDSFAKSEKKMKEGKTSGSKAKTKRKYIFTDELQFLKKVYTGREVRQSRICH